MKIQKYVFEAINILFGLSSNSLQLEVILKSSLID